MDKITVQATLSVGKQKAWSCYTRPEHITQWNFADVSWHCPYASNDMTVGGRYLARMEARDGSAGFDFDAIYTDIREGEYFTYQFGDRFATVSFKEDSGRTLVTVTFDPEKENPVDMQKSGWQAILNQYKHYTETLDSVMD